MEHLKGKLLAWQGELTAAPRLRGSLCGVTGPRAARPSRLSASTFRWPQLVASGATRQSWQMAAPTPLPGS